MSGLGLGHGTHVPLPLPVTDDVGSVVIDGLTLSDLAQQAALGRVVDLDIIDGCVSSLVRMIEAGVLGQRALVCLVLDDVLFVALGGAIVSGPPRLPVVHRGHVVGPALLAGAGIRSPRPGVRGARGPALAQVAVRPPAASQVKVCQRGPDLFCPRSL